MINLYRQLTRVFYLLYIATSTRNWQADCKGRYLTNFDVILAVKCYVSNMVGS